MVLLPHTTSPGYTREIAVDTMKVVLYSRKQMALLKLIKDASPIGLFLQFDGTGF